LEYGGLPTAAMPLECGGLPTAATPLEWLLGKRQGSRATFRQIGVCIFRTFGPEWRRRLCSGVGKTWGAVAVL